MSSTVIPATSTACFSSMIENGCATSYTGMFTTDSFLYLLLIVFGIATVCLTIVFALDRDPDKNFKDFFKVVATIYGFCAFLVFVVVHAVFFVDPIINSYVAVTESDISSAVSEVYGSEVVLDDSFVYEVRKGEEFKHALPDGRTLEVTYSKFSSDGVGDPVNIRFTVSDSVIISK